MARYKVSVTVFKDPNGKTMAGPTFLHLLGDICQALSLIFLLGGIALIMDGELTPLRIIILAALIVADFLGGSLLHKTAKQKAQTRFLESLPKENAAQEKQQP